MFKKLLYVLCSIALTLLVFYGFTHSGLDAFIDGIENKTFDLRQSVISKHRAASKDIVIITIDDASYEYALDNIGEWPLPRGLYADLVEFVEQQNPRLIAFDMLFVKSAKNNTTDDKKLADVFRKYDNVFTAMNFDYQSEDLRKPQDLPAKLQIKLNDLSNDINFEENAFTNYRPILEEIINNTSNIGTVNISRSNDGILRKAPVLVKYRENFYPQMSFLMAYTATGNSSRELTLNENGTLTFSDRVIPLDKNGNAILNWYGARGSYQEIPLYKIIKKMNGENVQLNADFKDKIVFVGMTANSLFDLKTTPTDKLFPGVEVLATYVNNILDNNFVTKAPVGCTILLSVIISLIIGFITLKFVSASAMIFLTLLTYMGYTIFTFQMMKHFNLWVDLVSPLIFATIVFIAMLIVKYLIKSKDFELQYKLATTDGLTGLYNHRYFQEQMLNTLEHSKRYETEFSLIIIDIDYFKKFNDSFGHQCGDRVLRHVAQTLKRNVRATDIVCRYGGEEMSIILPNIGYQDAIFTAEKLCKTIAEQNIHTNNDKTAKVTISLGVATYPKDAQTTQDLIKIADDRLYKAKENGRNQVGG